MALEDWIDGVRETEPLPKYQEMKIRAWLACIEEGNPRVIEEVLERCRTDFETREFFLQQAEGVKHGD